MATIATYNRIIKSDVYHDNNLSIGFKRVHLLPKRMVQAMQLHFLLKINSDTTKYHNYSINFFAGMSEAEYKTYILTH